MSEETARTPRTFYEAVGGEETFTRLVRRFYQEVAADPVLRPVYPTQDLGPAEEHPRLRMRHVHFSIGETERDLWLKHMRTSLDELELPAALDAQLWDYLVMAAHSLVNVAPAGGPDQGGRGGIGLAPG